MVLDSIALALGLSPALVEGISFRQIGIEAGGGALIGALLGFVAKQVTKLIAIIIGLELALFKFLETRGVLQVDWNKLTNASANASDAAREGAESGATWVESFISTLPVGVGFTGGFVLGFKQG